MKLFLSLIFISFVAFSGQSFSVKKIVLLNSVVHDKIKIEKKIERIFRKKFSSNKYPVEIKVIHKADQEDLHRELNNASNSAVFWISHGAFAKIKTKGEQALGVRPMIFDYRGDNVADIFSKINPNIEYVAIIGCNSKGILDYYNNQGFSKNLKTYVADRKVIATFGLRKSIRKFKKHWRNGELKKGNKKGIAKGYFVSVTRSLDIETPRESIRSLKVINNKRVIALLPKIEPGSSSTQKIFIPKNTNNTKNKFQLEFSTSQGLGTSRSNVYIGDIYLESEGVNLWKLFAKSNGDYFGFNSKLFLFKGDSLPLIEVN